MSFIQKSTASNINLEVIEETVSHMVTKKIIYKDFRILNESCNSFTLTQILDDDVETLYLEKTKQNSSNVSSRIKRQLTNYTFTTASLQGTPYLPNYAAKFNAIEANLMAIIFCIFS